MSTCGRYIVAVVCIISGIAFGFAAVLFDDKTRWMLIAFAVVCFISTACCFPGRHLAVTNRIIGALIFLLYVVGIICAIREGELFSWPPSIPSVFSALLGMWIWGIPAGYVMIFGHLPYNPFEAHHETVDDETSDSEDEDEITESV